MSDLSDLLFRVEAAHNQLALENKRLVEEVDRLRANQIPPGAVTFVPTMDVLKPMQLERDALRQEVERLRAESKAESDARMDLCKQIRDTLTQAIDDSNRFGIVGLCEEAARIIRKQIVESKANQEAADEHIPDAGKMVPPEPAAERGGKYEVVHVGDTWHVQEIAGEWRWAECRTHALAISFCSFLNNGIATHQQLAEARVEIERLKDRVKDKDCTIEVYAQALFKHGAENADLRRDREAWDAVRKHGMGLGFPEAGTTHWIACVDGGWDDSHADPREAVLSLAKQLEGGK